MEKKARVENFKDLIVWQRGMQVVKAIYLTTAKLPESEKYGLCSQMRRCAVSIPSNIAEGKKRRHLRDYLRFLDIADGSAAELETQILIAQEIYPKLGFSAAAELLEEVQKMLNVMIGKLEAQERV